MKHFLILEAEQHESSSVGVITDIPNTIPGHKSFHERLLLACREHFDADVKLVEIEDNLFGYEGYTKAKIAVDSCGDSCTHDLLIYETWIY